VTFYFNYYLIAGFQTTADNVKIEQTVNITVKLRRPHFKP